MLITAKPLSQGTKIQFLQTMNKDLYILTIWQGVEPVLTGPFEDEEKRRVALTALKKEYGVEGSYFPVDMTVGSQIEIGVFKGKQ